MYICTVCHFETELDDAVVPTPNGLCVCLVCYARITGDYVPTSHHLRQEVYEATAGMMPEETRNFRNPYGYRP